MSSITERSGATANQRTVDFDRDIVFLGKNEYKQETYASQGANTDLPAGTVMGKVNTSGEVVELKSISPACGPLKNTSSSKVSSNILIEA